MSFIQVVMVAFSLSCLVSFAAGYAIGSGRGWFKGYEAGATDTKEHLERFWK
jgi:hypothetical protein